MEAYCSSLHLPIRKDNYLKNPAVRHNASFDPPKGLPGHAEVAEKSGIKNLGQIRELPNEDF